MLAQNNNIFKLYISGDGHENIFERKIICKIYLFLFKFLNYNNYNNIAPITTYYF
jgi:hypothetical protein